MQENNKNTNQSFLDRFKGRANRIDKHGPNHALQPIKLPSPPHNNNTLPLQRKKLASLDHNSHQQEYQMPKVDLDQLIPSNPEGQYPSNHSAKRSINTTKITQKKIEYVPSVYDPNKTPGAISLKQASIGLNMPPSRSISDRSQNLHRRVFGKYLKLDEQAMRHLQFLQQLNKNRGNSSKANSFTN